MPHYEWPSFHLYCFPSGPIGTNSYCFICKETLEAACIDAPSDSWLTVQRACATHKAQLKKLILTHSHWDHIAEVDKYVEQFGIPVLVHAEDAYNLKEPGADGLSTRVAINGVTPSGFLQDQEEVAIGKTKWKVLHTPGHSPGCICLYCEKEKVLISGDTLFKGSMGRLDLPTGQPERMWNSLKRLSQLDPETKVFPGHGPPTTIGQEHWLANAQAHFGL